MCCCSYTYYRCLCYFDLPVQDHFPNTDSFKLNPLSGEPRRLMTVFKL